MKKIDLGNIKNIRINSKDVCSGDVFVAIKGEKFDGHDYIKESLLKGAKYVICEKCDFVLDKEQNKRIVIVNDSRIALADISKEKFNDPSNSLFVCGITGTNGKTTTTYIVDYLLNKLWKNSGFISTVFIKTKENFLERSNMTTPDCVTLNKYLKDMFVNGKKAAVIEVSSHAIVQKRIHGIKLDRAVFTNISPEHLDYHKNMDKYLNDKYKIFCNLKENGVAILNYDDNRVMSLKDRIKNKIITFGLSSKADVSATNIKMFSDRTEFLLNYSNLGSIDVSIPLIGKHNVYNVLSSLCVVLDFGFDLKKIKNVLLSINAVPGRLSLVNSNAPFKVFIDYAHTPDALERVLLCLKDLTNNSVICVFGCGGNRDKTKRKKMGYLATKIADKSIFTDDNPRYENSMDIINDIKKGVINKNYYVINNRKEAIKKAFDIAKKNDIVVICGKGHEDYQIIGDKILHFSDKEFCVKFLEEKGYKVF